MLIIGAGGFAKEILDTIENVNIACYDDINDHKMLFSKFPILHTEEEVSAYFSQNGPDYTIGIGNPTSRNSMCDKINKLGGVLTTTISKNALIGEHEVFIGAGCNILHGAIISNSTTVGKGCIIYYNTIITHDCVIGDFVELSPSTCILGGVNIEDYVQVGANATILPNVKIGKNSIIGAGAVVTKDVPANTLVTGVPAKIQKTL